MDGARLERVVNERLKSWTETVYRNGSDPTMLEEIDRVFIFPKSDVNNAIFECSVRSPVILLTSH
jgi:hypothetical protein